MTRDAASIGAGLAPGRAARPIAPGERIHVVGVAGAGASAAALLARRGGADPDGCDPGGPSPYTPALEREGVRVAWKHDRAHVTRRPGPDRLAVTKALTAVAPDHPELAAARELGIPLEPWQQVVADAAVGRRLVGVAGTHGKSTTSGWLVHLLVAAGTDPSAFVGALMPSAVTGGLPATARWGAGDAFVVEADEYAGNFDPYRPDVAVLTSAEWDHPDVFADFDAVVQAFARWLLAAADGRAPAGAHPAAGARAAGDGSAAGVRPAAAAGRSAAAGPPTLVANVGDPGVELVLERLIGAGWRGRLVAVSLVDRAVQHLGGHAREIAERYAGATVEAGDADLPPLATGAGGAAGAAGRRDGLVPGVLLGRIVRTEPATTEVELHGLDPLGGPLRVRLPTAGRHNAANALAVAATATTLGLTPRAIVEGLATFPGVGRRLERKGEAAGVVVYDDYGHHPTAIRETLLAVRQREPGRRVWAVYEPLTYHRTAALLDSFAEALAAADAVAVADVWAGRDTDTTLTSAAALAEAIARLRPGLAIGAPGSPEATAAWLSREVRPGDVVLVMGGGHSYRIGELLLEALGRDG